LRLLPQLGATIAVDVAIRARREAYLASVEALQSDVEIIRERVTKATPGA